MLNDVLLSVVVPLMVTLTNKHCILAVSQTLTLYTT